MEPCCTAKWQIVLLDNAVLQGTSGGVSFSDEVTVVASRGYLSLLPVIGLGQDPVQNFTALAATGVVATMGLRKSDVTSNNPFGDQYDLLSSEDYTESKQRRTWEHQAWPRGDIFSMRGTVADGPYAVCSQVTGRIKECIDDNEVCIIPESLSDGTGFTWKTWLSGAEAADPIRYDIDTNCERVKYDGDNQAIDYSVGLKPPSPWKWNLTSRQHYKLREDEQLALHIEASFFDAVPPDAAPPSAFWWMGRCKLLLEF